MKTLTIFTPTFNRAYCLGDIYASLLRQSSSDFHWLIIDDGSTDATQTLVEGWITEAKISIEYIYKENGGLHTAYNTAIAHLKTPLAVCIDSDDFPPDNAVALIVDFWKTNGNASYAGIIGLDFYKGGGAIGGDLPAVKSVHIIELTDKYGYVGDTKMVHRTELLQAIPPMPTFKGEKNFNPIYLYLQVDMHYPLLVLNENLCFVEYADTGMSRNIFHQYVNSPNSFAAMRKLNMVLPKASYRFVFKNAIHYVSSCLFAKNWRGLTQSPRKITTLLALPFGILLYFYIQFKTR
ncbi:MAG: hypothetical protein RLZZ500_1589 [Bacteroidota bacterium]|jgi:glycosyltransferase involved in cell wall biosynthesis